MAGNGFAYHFYFLLKGNWYFKFVFCSAYLTVCNNAIGFCNKIMCMQSVGMWSNGAVKFKVIPYDYK